MVARCVGVEHLVGDVADAEHRVVTLDVLGVALEVDRVEHIVDGAFGLVVYIGDEAAEQLTVELLFERRVVLVELEPSVRRRVQSAVLQCVEEVGTDDGRQCEHVGYGVELVAVLAHIVAFDKVVRRRCLVGDADLLDLVDELIVLGHVDVAVAVILIGYDQDELIVGALDLSLSEALFLFGRLVGERDVVERHQPLEVCGRDRDRDAQHDDDDGHPLVGDRLADKVEPRGDDPIVVGLVDQFLGQYE